MSQRGIKYALNKYGIRAQRGVFDNGGDASPIWPTLHLQDVTTAPTVTQVSGDIYQNAGRLYLSDGTSYAPIAGRRVIKNAAATLTASDSGALCVWSTAAGYTFTLPTAAAGLWFEFVVAVTITSSAAKVITASASEFILGSFLQIPDTEEQIVARNADGTTIRAWSGNGTTTGGYAGDSFILSAISATQWVVSQGAGLATGTEATPWATS